MAAETKKDKCGFCNRPINIDSETLVKLDMVNAIKHASNFKEVEVIEGSRIMNFCSTTCLLLSMLDSFESSVSPFSDPTREICHVLKLGIILESLNPDTRRRVEEIKNTSFTDLYNRREKE